MSKINLMDLDAMLHTIAHVQYSSGNRSSIDTVKNHVKTFLGTVQKNSQCNSSIMFFQDIGFKNYRNDILPEYKGHRETPDAIKLWKPTIIETFKELGATGLKFIESDDLQSALAHKLGFTNVVITSSDKDMKQVPGLHYNPYKRNVTPEERWVNMSVDESRKFLYSQILAGDPTDMPNEFCGIQGVGMGTKGDYKSGKAYKIVKAGLLEGLSYEEIVKNAYSSKYGEKEGYKRALVTMRMVRTLTGSPADSYTNANAQSELDTLLQKSDYLDVKHKDNPGKLFNPTSSDTILTWNLRRS